MVTAAILAAAGGADVLLVMRSRQAWAPSLAPEPWLLAVLPGDVHSLAGTLADPYRTADGNG